MVTNVRAAIRSTSHPFHTESSISGTISGILVDIVAAIG